MWWPRKTRSKCQNFKNPFYYTIAIPSNFTIICNLFKLNFYQSYQFFKMQVTLLYTEKTIRQRLWPGFPGPPHIHDLNLIRHKIHFHIKVFFYTTHILNQRYTLAYQFQVKFRRLKLKILRSCIKILIVIWWTGYFQNMWPLTHSIFAQRTSYDSSGSDKFINKNTPDRSRYWFY